MSLRIRQKIQKLLLEAFRFVMRLHGTAKQYTLQENRMKNDYAILGLEKGATQEEIKKAYFAKVKECSPEKDPAGFQLIRAAYDRLTGKFVSEEDQLLNELKRYMDVPEYDDDDSRKDLLTFHLSNASTNQKIDSCRRILKEYPDDAFLWFLLSLQYNHARKFAKAIQASEKSLKLDPDNLMYKSMLALAYSGKGDHKRALALESECFQKGLRECAFISHYAEDLVNFKEDYISALDAYTTYLEETTPRNAADAEVHCAFSFFIYSNIIMLQNTSLSLSAELQNRICEVVVKVPHDIKDLSPQMFVFACQSGLQTLYLLDPSLMEAACARLRADMDTIPTDKWNDADVQALKEMLEHFDDIDWERVADSGEYDSDEYDSDDDDFLLDDMDDIDPLDVPLYDDDIPDQAAEALVYALYNDKDSEELNRFVITDAALVIMEVFQNLDELRAFADVVESRYPDHFQSLKDFFSTIRRTSNLSFYRDKLLKYYVRNADAYTKNVYASLYPEKYQAYASRH